MGRWTTPVNVAGDVVNVKDFGAKGDGHSEDQAAIQAAVNSLGASGGVVLLPPGHYKITKTIHVSADASAKTSVWFRGSGSRNGTNLYWYGDADSAMIQVSGSSTYGSTFHRFSDFQLDAGTSTPPKYGIYLTGASNGGATGVTNTRFERIYIAHAQVGLQIGDATQPNVAENWFTEIQVDGCIGSGAVVTGSVRANSILMPIMPAPCIY